MRTLPVLLLLAAALAAPACKTAPQEQPQQPSTGDASGAGKIRFKSEGTQGGGGAGVVDYAMAPIENIIWIPWKIIGAGFKGVSDGVGAGFSKNSSGEQRMPAMGFLFSPVNAVAGLVTGMVEGIAMRPMLVGPEDSFGRAMALPPKHATTIWWYE